MIVLKTFLYSNGLLPKFLCACLCFVVSEAQVRVQTAFCMVLDCIGSTFSSSHGFIS